MAATPQEMPQGATPQAAWWGRLNSASSITACYATGDATGSIDVGGLVGVNAGLITACYATGDATGSADVGGLVGVSIGTITACYATGNAETTAANGDAGGLVGYNHRSSATRFGVIAGCYATGTAEATANTWRSRRPRGRKRKYNTCLLLDRRRNGNRNKQRRRRPRSAEQRGQCHHYSLLLDRRRHRHCRFRRSCGSQPSRRHQLQPATMTAISQIGAPQMRTIKPPQPCKIRSITQASTPPGMWTWTTCRVMMILGTLEKIVSILYLRPTGTTTAQLQSTNSENQTPSPSYKAEADPP